jgi:probable F420-dependent oxidoreductase
MDIGCHLPTQGPLATREALLTFCREAEARNIASLWVSDHVIFPRTASGQYPGGRFPFQPDVAYLEPVAVLTAAAIATERARLGASVFILGHRHPVVMAKMLTTIDALSKGRLICGVGVGWWKEEMTILGAPFHQRGRQADEILRVWKELWTSDHPRFKGEFYEFDDIGFAPKPVQKPHPPIWVGGDSPGAFRRVATLGDGWHATSKTPQEMEKSLGALRAAADAAGRSMSSIELSVRVSLKEAALRESKQAIVDQLAGYKRLGLTHVVLDFRRDTLAEMLEALDMVATEIRPAVDRS